MTALSPFRPDDFALPATTAGERAAEANTPTTPRQHARFSDQPPKEITTDTTNPVTPTRHDFGGIPGQRALPDAPFSPTQMSEPPTPAQTDLNREGSHRSTHSHNSGDSQDVEMMDEEEDQDESDNDSTTSDSQRPRKKKKGQRFFCNEFPPCQLSFTRSEHLARHIRKHTGERPFQCHCSRRFSRLDNLRQHAQTVHVNEEIPGDSLAATGTRFQRQIRTDRVRPPNSRARASTSSSQGAHSRGHSRNLSASSIASTTSNVSLPEEGRRRPPPLAMAQQDGAPRARITLDTFVPPGTTPAPQHGYYHPQQSPSGYSTPTSATFSNADGSSPRFQSAMQSPSSTISRSSFYNGSRAPARRLSVPSAMSPYQQAPHGTTYPPVYFTPIPSSTGSTFSNTGSVLASPTSSVYTHGRRESEAELEWRRRTWHPGTYQNYVARPATSGLTYHQTPDDTKPSLAPQPAASQITRLPGIESFDHVAPQPVPQSRLPGLLHVDTSGRSAAFAAPAEPSTAGPDGGRRNSGWEAGLQDNLNRLDIANATPSKQPRGYAEQSLSNRSSLADQPTGRINHGFSQPQPNLVTFGEVPRSTSQRLSVDEPDAKRNRRQAWYGGPVSYPSGSKPIMIAQRRSPEDSSSSEGVPTPSTSQGTELHPAIMHANGMIEMQRPGGVLSEEQQKVVQSQAQSKPEPTRADSGFQTYRHPPSYLPGAYAMHTGHDGVSPAYAQASFRPANDMNRLEALVAVATSENHAIQNPS